MLLLNISRIQQLLSSDKGLFTIEFFSSNQIIGCLIWCVVFIYAVLMIFYRYGWKSLKKANALSNDLPKVSLIVSLRNEEHNISNLVNCIKNQSYAENKLEVICINDHSTDNTLELLLSEKNKWSKLNVVNLEEKERGKKMAIQKGVYLSTGEIIITTDADCVFNKEWINSMVKYFANPTTHLVAGPVEFEKEESFFYKLQDLEFLSLIGAGAASIGVNQPMYANGANLAYRRSTFLKVDPFDNSKSPSGDDVFLVHAIKSNYSKSIAFAKDHNAIVKTKSKKSLTSFFNQRKRWASKTIYYHDIFTLLIGSLVFLTNLVILFFLLGFIFSLFSPYISIIDFALPLLFLIFYKSCFDGFLLYSVLAFFKRKYLIKWLIPLQIIYPLYIISVSLLSVTFSFEWKQRLYKP